MSKKAPVRCAASFKETHKGVWGDFPNKQNGAPHRCSVFCLWRPKGIACYNMCVFFTLCVGYLKNDCLFQRVSLKYHRQIVRTLYLFLNMSQFNDIIYL